MDLFSIHETEWSEIERKWAISLRKIIDVMAQDQHTTWDLRWYHCESNSMLQDEKWQKSLVKWSARYDGKIRAMAELYGKAEPGASFTIPSTKMINPSRDWPIWPSTKIQDNYLHQVRK